MLIEAVKSIKKNRVKEKIPRRFPMNINVHDIILKAHKRIDKKYMDDPSYLLRKRVLNTAASVLEKIDDITFEDLASDNFFICKEVGFKYFSDKYRAALEFAKVQPEKLPDELYKLFRDTGKEVKKNGKLEEFFLFLSLFEENTAVSEKYKEEVEQAIKNEKGEN